MRVRTIIPVISFALLVTSVAHSAAAEEFDAAIRAFLQHRANIEKRKGCIVIGLIDEQGSRVISHGKRDDNGEEANGDTVFGIYSQTCVYTALLLHDMVERGQMKLDDPVAKHLPPSVKMPTRNGKEITLRHLVTETCGLPDFAEKLDPKRADNPFADYTVEKMYGFLSDYELTRNPGAEFQHGGVGMGLLGHVIALKAGADYESLVVDRICRPLQMDSTRVTLTAEQTSRLAARRNAADYAMPDMEWGVLAPLAGLHSTANDLLKFVSANLGLTRSSVTPLLEKHVDHLVWGGSQGKGIVHIGGGAMHGSSVYSGFDKARRRGVVVLSTSANGKYNSRDIGKFLLESEWQSDRRPSEARISGDVCASYEGQYQRSPDLALGVFAARQFLRRAPKAAVYIPATACLAIVALLLYHAGNSRKRWMILGSTTVASAVLAPLIAVVASHVFCKRFQPRIAIRRDGERIFAQASGKKLWPIGDWHYAEATGSGSFPIDASFPPIPVELLPESQTRFVERVSGMPLTFSQDALTLRYQGHTLSYERISSQPPDVAASPKRPLPVKLDTKLLDACIGEYEFAPHAATGFKLKIWREGEQLFGQAWGTDVARGAFEIYPESETAFFLKIDGAQLTFRKNGRGEVTAVTHRLAGYPDIEGKKVGSPSVEAR